jgi:hypothetical protein
MEWKPIETAPKDGTWILVYGEGTEDEGEKRSVAVAQYTNYLNCETTDWHWQFAWYDGGYYGKFENPTHWMPLPEPPNKELTGSRSESESTGR